MLVMSLSWSGEEVVIVTIVLELPWRIPSPEGQASLLSTPLSSHSSTGILAAGFGVAVAVGAGVGVLVGAGLGVGVVCPVIWCGGLLVGACFGVLMTVCVYFGGEVAGGSG